MEKKECSQRKPASSFPRKTPRDVQKGNEIRPFALGDKWLMAHKVKVEQVMTRLQIRKVEEGFQLEQDWVRWPEKIVLREGRRQVFSTEAEAEEEGKWWAEKERIEHEAKANEAKKAEATYSNPSSPEGLQRRLNFTIFRKQYSATLKAIGAKSPPEAIQEALDHDMVRVFGRTLSHTRAQLEGLVRAMRRKPKRNHLIETLVKCYSKENWKTLTLEGVAEAIKGKTGKHYPAKTISSALGVLQVHHRQRGRPAIS